MYMKTPSDIPRRKITYSVRGVTVSEGDTLAIEVEADVLDVAALALTVCNHDLVELGSWTDHEDQLVLRVVDDLELDGFAVNTGKGVVADGGAGRTIRIRNGWVGGVRRRGTGVLTTIHLEVSVVMLTLCRLRKINRDVQAVVDNGDQDWKLSRYGRLKRPSPITKTGWVRAVASCLNESSGRKGCSLKRAFPSSWHLVLAGPQRTHSPTRLGPTGYYPTMVTPGEFVPQEASPQRLSHRGSPTEFKPQEFAPHDFIP